MRINVNDLCSGSGIREMDWRRYSVVSRIGESTSEGRSDGGGDACHV